MVFNHNLKYRPLCGGIGILNPVVNEAGTLGFIATSDGQDRWIVSCYHVLNRVDLSAANDIEPIYQPVDDPELLIARTDLTRSDPNLDCSAARVEPGIKCSAQILGLPPVAGVADPVAGMRVGKSGSLTGVTEGIIEDVTGDLVKIVIPPAFPKNFELTKPGDSGSLWIDLASGKAVALHKTASSFGTPEARATPISSVLASLRLRFL